MEETAEKTLLRARIASVTGRLACGFAFGWLRTRGGFSAGVTAIFLVEQTLQKPRFCGTRVARIACVAVAGADLSEG